MLLGAFAAGEAFFLVKKVNGEGLGLFLTDSFGGRSGHSDGQAVCWCFAMKPLGTTTTNFAHDGAIERAVQNLAWTSPMTYDIFQFTLAGLSE